ncbi:uncharacterized protein [Nothobranchius furzeri]|uniref:uncharacterized protein isoform X2 n=1 Tax=Nothobranchius furzeri TaxID=105023 RepID=UPI003904CE1E
MDAERFESWLKAHCQTETHKKKVQVIASTHSVASTFLPSRETASRSQDLVSQGPEMIREQCQAKMPVSAVNRIANAELLMPFLANFRKAYTTTALYLQKKLLWASPTLMALSALDPLERGHSQSAIQLKKLSGMLQHLLPAHQDIQRGLLKLNVDLSHPSFKEGDNMVGWWGHV